MVETKLTQALELGASSQTESNRVENFITTEREEEKEDVEVEGFVLLNIEQEDEHAGIYETSIDEGAEKVQECMDENKSGRRAFGFAFGSWFSKGLTSRSQSLTALDATTPNVSVVSLESLESKAAELQQDNKYAVSSEAEKLIAPKKSASKKQSIFASLPSFSLRLSLKKTSQRRKTLLERQREIIQGRTQCNRVSLDWFHELEAGHSAVWISELDMYCSLLAALGALGEGGLCERSINSPRSPRMDQRENNTCKPQILSEQGYEGESQVLSAEEEEEEAKGDSRSSDESESSHLGDFKKKEQSEGELEFDIPRTYNGIPWFETEDARYRLRCLVVRVTVKYEDMCYVPGMNYVLAQLMLHSTCDDIAFDLFCRLVEEPAFNLRYMYRSDFPLLERCIFVLDLLLQDFQPALHEELKRLGLGLMDFAVDWFLTLFSYSMPFEMLIKVWDRFFASGWQVFFRVSLVLLEEAGDIILENKNVSLCEALTVLRSSPIFPPEDLLVRVDGLNFNCTHQTAANEVTLL